MRARRPAAIISRASADVSAPNSGNNGVRPVPASRSSRYRLTSSRNRSPNAMWVNPSATARSTAPRMARSYTSFGHGDGIGICHSGSPSAPACACSTSTRTACIATRCAASLIVVSRPPISTPCCRRTCTIQALSLPLDHDISVFI